MPDPIRFYHCILESHIYVRFHFPGKPQIFMLLVQFLVDETFIPVEMLLGFQILLS